MGFLPPVEKWLGSRHEGREKKHHHDASDDGSAGSREP
jgi:hypothetical protein